MHSCAGMRINPEETAIESLGRAKIPSPMAFGQFISDKDAVLVDITRGEMDNGRVKPVFFEQAGPRKDIYFDPSKVKCAVVTCGGLCPGLNDVIRAIVMSAHHHYRVASVLGVRYGLSGFAPSYGHEVMELAPGNVTQIHEFGGTILGTSRGPQPVEDIVDALERMNVCVVFMIGGDGTMRAAAKVRDEVARRNNRIAVVGIPKTIDNDINFAAPSFGFDTAVEKATEAIRSAHTEALGAPNGIGLVKLMGRESGFIAAQSSLALKDVNFVLVPEDDFEFKGENGLLRALERRLESRGHAVIVVAEGAGQKLLGKTGRKDASGNAVLSDVAGLIKSEILDFFKARGRDVTLKYIDPSYIIRAVPANSNDRVYCGFLGQNAVHAAMAGKTGMVVSRWNGRYVHIPLGLVTRQRKRINICSNYWRAVLESTGQPLRLRD
ncbi:MAG: ATP-dependent 6-phosphofructokinase [Desulfovibrionaceae bacterium]|nr:ATP-dependent 6-phosphofructokinase [Desulfovibrionaceae bacterium]MDD4951034.1 ATP-dependent 6-phosphofructokinase [Desulfovibrionaceae bacterium]